MRVERLVFEALDKYFWWHKGVDAEKRVTVTIDPYDYLYAYSKQDSDIIWFAGRILVEKISARPSTAHDAECGSRGWHVA